VVHLDYLDSKDQQDKMVFRDLSAHLVIAVLRVVRVCQAFPVLKALVETQVEMDELPN